MKRAILIILLLFWQLSYAQNDRRNNKKSIVIGTFNTNFLWDGIKPEDGIIDNIHKNNPQVAAQHMKNIAHVIKEINADILNIIEVESFEALKYFNDNYLTEMNYHAYLVKGLDSYTGQDVGLLTRIDPENNEIYRYAEKGNYNGYKKSVSKNYFAKFIIDNKKFALVSIHLLAFPNNTSNIIKRQAQADAVKNISQKLSIEGYNVILLGDFNDYDGDTCCLDINNNKPITTILNDLKQLDKSTNKDDLLNAHQFISKSQRYTAHYDKNRNHKVDNIEEYSSIDHILIDTKLAPYIYDVRIHQDFNPTIISDHFPITITLNL